MRTRIIELAGLPGSGKSTIAKRLARDAGRARSARISALLMRARLHWLALPLVLLRFARVISRLRDEVSPRETREMLNKLCRVTTERALARIESLVCRALVLLDEGYVQVGVRLWMRVPEESREEIWQAFVARVPGSVVCLYVDLDPDEALRRTALRGTETRVPCHRELATRLRAEAPGQRFRLLLVETDGASAGEAADRALESLAPFAPAGLVVLCRFDALPRRK